MYMQNPYFAAGFAYTNRCMSRFKTSYTIANRLPS